MAGPEDKQHRNDIYGDISKRTEAEAAPPIPAATVVLLRDGNSGPEVLMLRKNSKIAFGGMWVFPGGKIDEADYPDDRDAHVAARNAAARETMEEAGIHTEPGDFVHFAHWTPPPSSPKRFATWFFAAHTGGDDAVNIDDGEIKEHAWITPTAALTRHAAGEIDLVPPTWITLHHLSLYQPATRVLEQFRDQGTKVYNTRVAQNADGVRVAMWLGDAGYNEWNPDIDGERHRLVMASNGFAFENTVERY